MLYSKNVLKQICSGQPLGQPVRRRRAIYIDTVAAKIGRTQTKPNGVTRYQRCDCLLSRDITGRVKS
jgi:hypothetical protein